MIYHRTGSGSTSLSADDIRQGIFDALGRLGRRGKVLIVPPDMTRFHSQAGYITSLIFEYYQDAVKDILPALGTHSAMSDKELEMMYKEVPRHLFRVHDWRKDVLTAGIIPPEFIHGITRGAVHYAWPAQLNRLILEGGHDLILSVGQVVPHEVIGMANYNKNLLVGTGGPEGINKSHFIGAVYGMERIMGRSDNPVRRLLNEAAARFMKQLPVVYIHTVVAPDETGKPAIRGLYIGDDEDVFLSAADLSLKVNISVPEQPLKKVVVYLDPREYKSTWLGNKSIYRTRMAMDDQGELIILAPGIKTFGEDGEIDRLIRKYGYTGTAALLELTNEKEDLKHNLAAAAHLIHGSSENRFQITYCPGYLSREEIESVNFKYHDMKKMMKIYDPEMLKDGVNVMSSGEEVFYISNPAMGLWSTKDRLIDHD